MTIPQFENDETYLPVTLQQFQDLVNEVLVKFNEITAPNALDANYFCQVLHGVIHSLPRSQAKVKKSDLLDGAINMVSKHITYHAVQQIEAQMKAAAGENPLASVPDNEEVI